MHRALRWSQGGKLFLMSEVPLWWGTMQAIKDGRKAKVCPPSSFSSLLSSLELSDTTIFEP